MTYEEKEVLEARLARLQTIGTWILLLDVYIVIILTARGF